MIPLFSKFWWTFVLRGFVAVLFGLVVLLWPALSLDPLVVSFGIFALLQGILSAVPGVSKLGGRIYFLLIEGVVGILAGVLTFLGPGIGRMLWPEVATKTLLVFIAFVGPSFRYSGGDRVFSPSGRNERKMGDYPEWFCLSFAWPDSALSFRVRGCGKRFCDWTFCDCFWFPVVIHRFQGSQGVGLC